VEAFGVFAISLVFIKLAFGAAFCDAKQEVIGNIYILKNNIKVMAYNG
jgi:hypothetical protein